MVTEDLWRVVMPATVHLCQAWLVIIRHRGPFTWFVGGVDCPV